MLAQSTDVIQNDCKRMPMEENFEEPMEQGEGANLNKKRKVRDDHFPSSDKVGHVCLFFQKRPNYNTHGLCSKLDPKSNRLFCLRVDLSMVISVHLVKNMISLCEGEYDLIQCYPIGNSARVECRQSSSMGRWE